MKVTNMQIRAIHTLLPIEIKQDVAAKKDVIFQFTNDYNRTSTNDLTFHEAQALINKLKGDDYSFYAKFDSNIKQHLTLLSMCYNLNWVRFDDHLNRNVANLTMLGSWLEKYGYLHKPLQDYTDLELPKLVAQFSRVVKHDKLKSA